MSRFRALVAVGVVVAMTAAGGLAILAAEDEGGAGGAPAAGSSPVSSPTVEPGPEPSPEPLTRKEAVAEFRRLHELAHTLARHRDSFFMAQVFTESGPMLERSRTRVRELLEDHVLDNTEVRLDSAEVRFREEGSIRFLAVSRTTPCFVTESGRDVTQDRRVRQDTILWTMRWEGGSWKLHDAELRDQKSLGRPDTECSR